MEWTRPPEHASSNKRKGRCRQETKEPHFRRLSIRARVARKPGVVGAGSKRNTGSSSDESHARCRADRDGCSVVSFGVPMVQGGEERNPAWVIFFEDGAFSVDAQWEEDGVRCKALTASLVEAHLHTMGERGEEEGNP